MIAFALLLFLEAPPPAPPAVTPTEPSLTLPAADQLKQARATYEYGNYASAIDQLERLLASRRLESPQDQLEAYRLLGLAHFFSAHTEDARRAFVTLLSLDPDFQLDPLYVPPQAVRFLDQIRLDNKEGLEPIRTRKRATQEAQAQEEAARRRLLAQLNGSVTEIVHERIDRPSPLIALLPFGAGQFQNGNTALGVIFAATEGLALATSIASFAWVESQANASDGYYASSVYRTALAVRDVQVGTGIGFGLLWLIGTGEAFWHLRPPLITREAGPGPAAAPEPTPAKVTFLPELSPLPGGGQAGLRVAV